MDGSPIIRGRGRPRKIINKTIKRDLDVNSLNINMIYDKNTMISSNSCNQPHLVG